MLGEFSWINDPIASVTIYSMRQSYCISSGLHEKGPEMQIQPYLGGTEAFLIAL
jgi:hypothetical protein